MACMGIQNTLTPTKIERAFMLLDKDSSGTISVQEFKATLGENIPADYYQELLKELGVTSQDEVHPYHM